MKSTDDLEFQDLKRKVLKSAKKVSSLLGKILSDKHDTDCIKEVSEVKENIDKGIRLIEERE